MTAYIGNNPEEDHRLVTLKVYLGQNYPSTAEDAEMPVFELRGVNWRKRDQNEIYEGQLEKILYVCNCIYTQRCMYICMYRYNDEGTISFVYFF